MNKNMKWCFNCQRIKKLNAELLEMKIPLEKLGDKKEKMRQYYAQGGARMLKIQAAIGMNHEELLV